MIEVRLAHTKDIDRLVEITNEEEPANEENYRIFFERQVEANKNKNSDSFLFVAIVDSKVAAHGKMSNFYGQIETKFKSPKGWYFTGVIVDPKYRGQGLATKLLQMRESFILETSKEADIFSIVWSKNTPSINYHLKNDFQEVDRGHGFLMMEFEVGEAVLFHKKIKAQ